MRVSACLIVKDEERTLGRCLESIREHVDEIVVVDTGSRDGTKEIAHRHTQRVFDYPWRRDFAAARQFSFDRATGDWLFWLDADDVVHNAARIRDAVAAAPPDVNCFYWKYRAAHDEYGNAICEFWRERCVRNNRNFRWRGRVHEVLVPRSRAVVRRDEDVVVVHHRQTEGRDPRRNLTILQHEYAHSRGRPSPRLLYCLGSEYADLGQNGMALQYLRRYVKVSRWRDEKYFALLRIARLEQLASRYSEALAAGRQALDLFPGWPNACFYLAETYYYLQDWPSVVEWSEAGHQRPSPDTVCVMNPRDLQYSWIVYYTNALYHLGRVEDALAWTRKALEVCPGEQWHLLNERFFSERKEQQAETALPPAPPPDSTDTQQPGLSLSAPEPPERPEVLWHGPLFDPSGYAEEGREFVLGLHAIGTRIRTLPVNDWCPRRVDLGAAESGVLDRLVATAVDGADTTVLHMTPIHWRRIERGGYHIGRTMCESDRIPESWIGPCNAMDEVWVPCQHNIETFTGSGVAREKLIKIPEGIDPRRYQLSGPPLPIRGARAFNFLSVFEWSRRKGWDVLVRAFAAEFRSRDNVALILKTGAVGGQGAARIRQAIIAELRSAGLGAWLPSNIIIYSGNLAAAEMPALYRAAQAFVLPSRGEGWGRPLMEAMLMQLPAIGTRWSGPLEFMNDENSYLADCSVVEVPRAGWREAPVFQGHRWAEPSVRHLRQLMRRAFSEREEAARKARAAREHIIQNFSRERVAELVRKRLREVGGY
jgi:glycosyltransferase involved in cell wall biosynthesis